MIRVIIVHGSQSRRDMLVNIFASDDKVRVLAAFESSDEALFFIQSNEMSVVIVSDVIKDMSGYEFITKLMKKSPIAALLLVEGSNGDQRQEIDFPEALDYSVVDTFDATYKNGELLFKSRLFIKISILSKLNISKFQTQIDQINNYKRNILLQNKGATSVVELNKAPPLETTKAVLSKTTKVLERTRAGHAAEKSFIKVNYLMFNKIVVMGASTGGPRLLVYLISQLPERFPPVLVVQHMPEGFVGQFASRMNTNSRINVKKAENGDIVLPGNVYIAPGGYHMELAERNNDVFIRITDGPKVNFVKPSVDVTMFSAARLYGNKVVGVVLTGMGSDGREGSRVIKKVGGKVIALNEADSVIYGMNKSVVDAGLADSIVGMDSIVKEIAFFLE